MPKKLKIPPVMGLLQKNSRLKVHLVRFIGKSDLKMNEFEVNNDDSRRISPRHSTISVAFAKGNLYFKGTLMQISKSACIFVFI